MLRKGERKNLSGHKAKSSAQRLKTSVMLRLHLKPKECKLTVYVLLVKDLLIRDALWVFLTNV